MNAHAFPQSVSCLRGSKSSAYEYELLEKRSYRVEERDRKYPYSGDGDATSEQVLLRVVKFLFHPRDHLFECACSKESPFHRIGCRVYVNRFLGLR